MDSTKKPIGAATMVYKNYVFLKRWYEYYAAQFGAENLYIFSHGGDPEHQKIAPGASVIHVPRDPALFKFDRRRWRMMSFFISGMMEFYNWMILSDVDEIMIVDPDLAPDLLSYITATYGDFKTGPKNISPFALELIHVPDEEPEPLVDGETILSRRRIFRPNFNYSKPCLVRAPTVFGPGGHRNSLGPRHLSDGLYLLHLKFVDLDLMKARSKVKTETVQTAAETNDHFKSGHNWGALVESHRKILDETEIRGEDIRLEDYRAAMMQQTEKYQDQFVFGHIRTPYLYRIPERFAGVF